MRLAVVVHPGVFPRPRRDRLDNLIEADAAAIHAYVVGVDRVAASLERLPAVFASPGEEVFSALLDPW